jgi:hypothetical protein
LGHAIRLIPTVRHRHRRSFAGGIALCKPLLASPSAETKGAGLIAP